MLDLSILLEGGEDQDFLFVLHLGEEMWGQDVEDWYLSDRDKIGMFCNFFLTLFVVVIVLFVSKHECMSPSPVQAEVDLKEAVVADAKMISWRVLDIYIH